MKQVPPSFEEMYVLYEEEKKKLLKKVDAFEWRKLNYVEMYLQNKEEIPVQEGIDFLTSTGLEKVSYFRKRYTSMIFHLSIAEKEAGLEEMQEEVDIFGNRIQIYEKLVKAYPEDQVEVFEKQFINPFFEEDFGEDSIQMELSKKSDALLEQLVSLEIKMGETPSDKETACNICDNIYTEVVNHTYQTTLEQKEQRKQKKLSL